MSHKKELAFTIPKRFQMGQFTYRILTGDTHDKDLQSRQYYGDHSGVNKHIRIDSSLSAEQRHSTLIHELIEAANCNWCNSNIKHDTMSNLANGLSQALKSMGIRFDIRRE